MATNKRTYPNNYFSWYNDEDRLGILCEDTTTTTGERTQEKYDSFQGDGNLNGNLTASSTAAGAFVDFTSASHGLAVNDRVIISGTTTYDGNHAITVVGDANTFRITATNSEANEGAGDLQRAQYFRAMFDKMVKQYPLRKSGVRALAVPRL